MYELSVRMSRTSGLSHLARAAAAHGQRVVPLYSHPEIMMLL